MLPSSGVPSKMVLTQQCRQRCASSIADCGVVTDFNFGYARAPFQRQHRNRLPVDIEVIERHGCRLSTSTSIDRFRMLAAAQVLVNAHGCAFAVADAIDDQARAEHAVAAGKDAGGRRHQRLRIHRDQATRGEISTLSSGVKKSRRGAWPIAMMMVSHSIWLSLFS